MKKLLLSGICLSIGLIAMADGVLQNTSGTTTSGGPVVISGGSGTNYFGTNVNINGTLNVSGITNNGVLMSISSGATLCWHGGGGFAVSSSSYRYVSPTGTISQSADNAGNRVPSPITGTITNLIAGMAVSGAAPPASTNWGIVLFTNGVASNFTGTMLADGVKLTLYITNSSVPVVAGTMLSLQYTNNAASAANLQSGGAFQIVP